MESCRLTRSSPPGSNRIEASRPLCRVTAMNEVTRVLHQIEQGDPHAAGELLPLVYDELRRLATAGWPRNGPAKRFRLPPWFTRLICGWSATTPIGAGTIAATSSPRRPRPCGESWWSVPAASEDANTGAVFRPRTRTWMTFPDRNLGTRWRYWPFTRRWISSRQKRRVRPNW